MNSEDRSTYSMTPSPAMESLLADVRRTQRSSTDDSYSMFRVSLGQVIGEHAHHLTTDVISHRNIQYGTIVFEGLVGQGSPRFLSNAHSCEMETYSMDQQCSNLADSESSSYAESPTATVTYSMIRSSSMSSVKRMPTLMSSSLGRAARNILYVERSPEITSDVLGVPYSMNLSSFRHSCQHNNIIISSATPVVESVRHTVWHDLHRTIGLTTTTSPRSTRRYPMHTVCYVHPYVSPVSHGFGKRSASEDKPYSMFAAEFEDSGFRTQVLRLSMLYK